MRSYLTGIQSEKVTRSVCTALTWIDSDELSQLFRNVVSTVDSLLAIVLNEMFKTRRDISYWEKLIWSSNNQWENYWNVNLYNFNSNIYRSFVSNWKSMKETIKKCLFNKLNDSTPISNVDSSLQTHKSISSKFNLKNFSCYEEIDYHLAILKADLSDLAILLCHIYDAGLHSLILK